MLAILVSQLAFCFVSLTLALIPTASTQCDPITHLLEMYFFPLLFVTFDILFIVTF